MPTIQISGGVTCASSGDFIISSGPVSSSRFTGFIVATEPDVDEEIATPEPRPDGPTIWERLLEEDDDDL